MPQGRGCLRTSCPLVLKITTSRKNGKIRRLQSGYFLGRLLGVDSSSTITAQADAVNDTGTRICIRFFIRAELSRASRAPRHAVGFGRYSHTVRLFALKTGENILSGENRHKEGVVEMWLNDLLPETRPTRPTCSGIRNCPPLRRHAP